MRRADYFNAFTYWLKHKDPRLRRILFTENSGADLSEFHDAARKSGKEVEIISIPPHSPPPGMNYGYCEFEMIDRALSQSRLREQSTHLIKTTGRLIFPDLPELLDRLSDNVQVAVDARGKLPGRSHERGHITVQLFVASHEFYDTALRKSYLDLTPPHHYPHLIEHMFFELLAQRREKDVLLRFPVNCEPLGFSAHRNESYGTPRRMLTRKLRALSRLCEPWFWL